MRRKGLNHSQTIRVAIEKGQRDEFQGKEHRVLAQKDSRHRKVEDIDRRIEETFRGQLLQERKLIPRVVAETDLQKTNKVPRKTNPPLEKQTTRKRRTHQQTTTTPTRQSRILQSVQVLNQIT